MGYLRNRSKNKNIFVQRFSTPRGNKGQQSRATRFSIIDCTSTGGTDLISGDIGDVVNFLADLLNKAINTVLLKHAD